MTGKVHRGVSRAGWLEAGLNALGARGVIGVTIEGLAKDLGIAKAGFYWHFKNRDQLLQQILEYWTHEVTEVVSENRQIAEQPPGERLRATAEMILDYDLTRYEIPIRLWALHDDRAARAVEIVNKKRLDFVRAAFAELGFKGDDLEMRSLLFTCYQTWESPMFREISVERRRQLIEKRIDLLVSR